MGTVGTHAINSSLYKKMPFDPIKDFVPLTRVANVPNLLVANPSKPYKSVAELIAYAKANANKVNVGSSGNGTSIHLSAELFKTLANVDMTHVPYKGSAPAAVISKLNAAIVKVLGQADVRKMISEQGAEVYSEKPEQFAAFIQLEVIKWGKVVRDSGASLD